MYIRCRATLKPIRTCITYYHTSTPFYVNSHMNNMSKSLERALRAEHHQRKKSKSKLDNPNVQLQILGTGACGAPACLVALTSHTNYMFNCGEGTQRLANEHRMKLVKLEHVFVTNSSWNNLGGLPGLFLTVQENGIPEINLHGPNCLSNFVTEIQKFINLTTLKVNTSCDTSKPFIDNAVTIYYVPITKSIQKRKINVTEVADNTENYSSTKNVNGKRDIVTHESKNAAVKTEDSKSTTDTMCYICKTFPKKGALSLEKCLKFGVKPGPSLGQLKNGEDITLADGRIVYSKDVCMPDTPGSVFLVVDCPTEEHLDCFVNNEAFEKHQDQAQEEEDKASYVFHFTSEVILNNPRYREWMKKFSASTKHIILNLRNTCTGSEAVHKHQHELHILHPEMFPLLNDHPFKIEENAADSQIYHVKTMQKFFLNSSKTARNTEELSVQPEMYKEGIFQIPEFPDAFAELQKNISIQSKQLTDTSEYPKLIMLGTGSSIPNKVRNTSGILLRIDEKHSIIMDCGETTYGQLVRFYGKSEKDNILSTIKAIYVSHLHADHHIGLISLLQQRSMVTKDPLYLLAPNQVLLWLQSYSTLFEPISNLFFSVSNGSLMSAKSTLPTVDVTKLYNELNVEVINTCYVKHCAFSYGVAITLKNGKRIVYSGDTMPCDQLVQLGKNCDLLIHEATMEDDLAKEAEIKKHSTTSQAINAGRRMNAKFILLTHFSQRYCKIPQIPEAEDVGIAYDNMEIKLSQLPLIPLFYPALRIMYNEYYTLMEERATKRQRIHDAQK